MTTEMIYNEVSRFMQSDRWNEVKTFADSAPTFDQRTIRRILAMRPYATHVRLESDWAKHGRTIIEGERPILMVGGNHYDISQTEGDPLPQAIDYLRGNAPKGMYQGLATLARSRGFTVKSSKTELAQGVNGETRWAKRQVIINANNAPKQKVKTLAHELAHIEMHRYSSDRYKAEIEAETVAYLVCREFGVDTTPYSVGYVATWVPYGDIEYVFEGEIERTAKRLIEGLQAVIKV